MARDLLSLALATFNTTVLVAVGVLIAYLSAGLGDLLKGLDTLLGLGLFALLWLIVWLATGKVLTAVPLSEVVSWSGTKAALARGTLWGGVVGILFLVGAVLLTVVPQLFAPNAPLQPLSVLLIALIGGLIAVIIGGVVGLSFALIDVVIVRVAYRVQTETTRT